MEVIELKRNRAAKAKRAFTTRRVPARQMKTIISGDIKPVSGNVVLATVHELGKHLRLELLDGRRAIMMPGDEIIVCYGNRYAPINSKHWSVKISAYAILWLAAALHRARSVVTIACYRQHR